MKKIGVRVLLGCATFCLLISLVGCPMQLSTLLVVLDQQGGTGGVELVVPTYGKAMPDATAPTKPGFIFDGYYDGVDGEGSQYYSAAMVSTRQWDKLVSTTLYAKWILIHTVSFDCQDESAISSVEDVAYGDTITEPIFPIKDGFGIAGWYRESSCINQWAFASDTVTEDMTLYAKWILMHTVSFDSQEGSTVSSVENVFHEATITEPADPTRCGYSFGGWYQESSCVNQWTFASDTVTSDMTLYAKWILIHTVSFDSQEGSAVSSVENVFHEATITEPADPTRCGYSFGGWYQESSCVNQWAFASDTVVEDMTLYAKWDANTDTAYTVEHWWQNASGSGYSKHETEALSGTTGEPVTAIAKTYTGLYENTTATGRVASGTLVGEGALVLRVYYDWDTFSVSFDEDQGSTVNDLTGVRYGATVTEPAEPTRSGYVFTGWYRESSCTTLWVFTSDTVTADMTLYVKWVANTNTAYTVEYWQQDVSGSGYSKYETKVLSGISGELVTATAKTYAGFNEITTHASRVASGIITGDGSLVLKLYYDRNIYSVSFDEDGGSTVSDLSGVRYGMMFTEPAEPTRDGYAFGDWYRESSFKTKWIFASDTVTADMTLYAKWDAYSHNLRFDANGGSGTMIEVPLETDEQSTLPTNAFTRTGYTFVGWATTGDSGVTYANKAKYTMGATDQTLYAKWTADSHELRFDANGGIGTMSDMSLGTDEQTILPTNTFTKTGYSFSGWATASNSSVEYDDGDSYTMGNLDQNWLYAKWTANIYTVNFDKQGGFGGTSSVSATYDMAMPNDEIATAKAGYIFDGYYDQVDGEGTQYYSMTMRSTWNWDKDEDTTLYAKWKVPQVGELGPSGGYVFYDKGSYSSGWRYLEAAPASTECICHWGTHGWTIEGTGTEIGSGESNTSKIVTTQGIGDQWGRPYAAKLCEDLEVDKDCATYDDWFLPSKDELNEMYKELYSNTLGFTEDGYLSSSESSENEVWIQTFKEGNQSDHAEKYLTYFRARAVRAF
jgi:uncharacterized repeat protein (TIGR02543 family)